MAKYVIEGGSDGSVFDFIDEKFKPTNLNDFLLTKKAEIDKGLRNSWNKEYKRVHPDRTSSLSLMQSVGVEITKSPNYVSLVVTADEAWKFVDKGVKGRVSSSKAPKSPFKFKKKNLPKDIRKSIVRDSGLKGIRGEKQAESVGYLIGRSITEKGLEPIPFVSNYIEKVKKDFKEDLRNFMTNA